MAHDWYDAISVDEARLGAADPRIRRGNRPGYSKYGPITFEHHKRCVLIGEPLQCCEGHNTIRTDHDDSTESMSDAREPSFATGTPDSIFQDEMTVRNPNLNAVPAERHNAMLGPDLLDTLNRLCIHLFPAGFRVALAEFESTNAAFGVFDPTRLMAVRAVIP
jgi:hypothetical protein